MYLLNLLKVIQTKSVLSNNFLLTEIYNFILIYVSVCILIITLSFVVFKIIIFVIEYVGRIYLYFKYTII